MRRKGGNKVSCVRFKKAFWDELLSPILAAVGATKWGQNSKVMVVVRRRNVPVLMNRPCGKQLAVEA